MTFGMTDRSGPTIRRRCCAGRRSAPLRPRRRSRSGSTRTPPDCLSPPAPLQQGPAVTAGQKENHGNYCLHRGAAPQGDACQGVASPKDKGTNQPDVEEIMAGIRRTARERAEEGGKTEREFKADLRKRMLQPLARGFTDDFAEGVRSRDQVRWNIGLKSTRFHGSSSAPMRVLRRLFSPLTRLLPESGAGRGTGGPSGRDQRVPPSAAVGDEPGSRSRAAGAGSGQAGTPAARGERRVLVRRGVGRRRDTPAERRPLGGQG